MKKGKKKRKSQRSSTSVRKKRTKQRDYVSDGVSSTTNMYALKTERIRVIIMYVIEVIGIIGGIILIFCNVLDEDFCLEFSNFKLRCSLAGLVITIISLFALIRTNPKTNIKNEK